VIITRAITPTIVAITHARYPHPNPTRSRHRATTHRHASDGRGCIRTAQNRASSSRVSTVVVERGFIDTYVVVIVIVVVVVIIARTSHVVVRRRASS
jgi:hypothetical protein